jgi:hypothetical protein
MHLALRISIGIFQLVMGVLCALLAFSALNSQAMNASKEIKRVAAWPVSLR